MKSVARFLIRNITGARKYQYKKVSDYAEGKVGLNILELGSGKKENGEYVYSAGHLFSSENTFHRTDIVESFGHELLDVTKMKYSNEFDLILCLNVLEHVFDYELALDNIHRALKKNGTVLIALPMYYPLHDEPADYWRFTEHSLRVLLKKYKSITVDYKGKREFPYCYFIEAVK